MKEVGSGTYGTVYKAKDLQTDQIVAVKAVKFLSIEIGLRALSRELKILIKLSKMENNDFTVKLLDLYLEDGLDLDSYK